MLFGNFQIIIKTYVDKCLEKRCREIIESNLNDTQCSFRPGRSTTDHISLSSNFLRNLGSMPKTSTHVLSTSRTHTTGFLVKSFGECCEVLTAACYWSSSHCIPAHKFVSVSGELIHDRSPLVLDSEGVCCHRSFHSLHQWFSTFSLKGAKSRPTIFSVSLTKNFQHNSIHTFCFIAERSLLHKMLNVLLKDCSGSHKGCLGAEYGPQNRAWEPLVYMNWIDSHSRLDEGVTVGSCRINRSLFADDFELLASFNSLQHALDRFSAACGQAAMKINTINRGAMPLYKPKAVDAAIHCSRWRSSST